MCKRCPLRVAGADEGALRDAFRTTLEADETNVITDATVGGKSVLAVSNDDGVKTTYLYVKNDVVFLVGASSQELAADALSQLP